MARSFLFMVVVVFLVVALSEPAGACPVCYGAADSQMIDGMNAAILVLVGITGMVLTMISIFFLYVRKRIRTIRKQYNGNPAVNEKGTLQWNNY